LKLSRSDSYSSFLRRFHRHIIVAWVLVLILAALYVPSFFSSVSFGISGASINVPNAESTRAQNIINAEFPSSANSTSNSILVVVQAPDVYSNATKTGILAINNSVYTDPAVAGFTGMESLYTVEYQLLQQSIPEVAAGASALASNITEINHALYALQQNLTALNTETYQLQGAINGTAGLVYGVPAAFVQAWTGALQACSSSVSCANSGANAAIAPELSGEALEYYDAFFEVWNGSFAAYPTPGTPTPLLREQSAVNATVTSFLSSPALNATAKQVFAAVATGLNVTDWDQGSSIANLTIGTVASMIPGSGAAELGVTPLELVQQAYDLGPSPSSSSLAALAMTLFGQLVTASEGSGHALSLASLGISLTQLLQDAYGLGPSPSGSAVWGLASGLVANTTAALFTSSPLFSVNATSLHGFLTTLGSQATPAQTDSEISSAIAREGYSSLPYTLSRSLTENLVSPDNTTMLLVLSFSTAPNSTTIQAVHTIVHGSTLASQGTVYVTGSTVLSQDLSNIISPAVGTTTLVGGAVALFIAAMLFLAPLAAVVPLLIAGISIVISLGAVDLFTTVVEKGSINFLTPFLMILVMLGLAVDYSVLQLRRTREERLNGRSKEESVALSVKWAGQAVITAALTVIVAYIVLAVAHIPFFGSVGSAIAIGVTVLLVVSVSLLPSLELALGDSLFWPSLHRSIRRQAPRVRRDRLYRLTHATLRRKAAVAVAISLFAAGSFYVVLKTPTGIDLVQLLPNFESNQGLTVLTSHFGGAASDPTQIVVTTPTPIAYGNGQFNLTLMKQIDAISSAAAGTTGVASVSGPTRPYGSPFNYSQLNGGASSPVVSQFLSGVLQDIGKNNETAIITVGLSSSPEGSQAIKALQQVQSNVAGVGVSKGVSVYYGGDTQSTYDAQSFINGLLPEVIVILAAAVYAILAFQLRSLFLPFQLVLTILCAAVFALATLSLIYFYALGEPVLNFSILFVVVTMLGVGTDYDIFLVTRIKEEAFVNGKSHEESIKVAISKVWVTLMGLGLILSSVFTSLIFTGIGLLSELGLTVASAVILDVAGVILFFVPALMGLAQSYNWWPSKPQTAPPAPDTTLAHGGDG
jgi:putative drug exporter of the RND superfamily